MRFVLVGPDLEENLSVGLLAAVLRRAGCVASVVPFNRAAEGEAVVRAVRAARPDVVGLSMTFQVRGREFLDLAARLREAGFDGHLTAGGHWASVAAEAILREAPALDSILVGEAEAGIVALAEALAGGRTLAAVPGAVFRRDGAIVRGPRPSRPVDLDALPLPARDAPPARHLGLPVAPLLASRGCRGRCAFCSGGAFAALGDGPVRRLRSPEGVAEEMAQLGRERGVRIFFFHDDDFLEGDRRTDLARLDRLQAALGRLEVGPVALVVKARPDDIDEAVVRMLLDLGLVRVFLGIETNAPAGLRALERGVTAQANRRALALLQRLDVLVCSNLLLWEPGTTLDDLRRNLALLREFPAQLFNLARTEAYEGAALTRRLAASGRLFGGPLGRDYEVTDARAELAWRLFHVVLGERCYDPDGAINAAMDLVYRARLLRRFFPSERAERLQAEACAAAEPVARGTAAALERIVEASGRFAPGLEAQVTPFALDLARSVRAADARMLAAIRRCRAEVERCARGLPERLEEPSTPPRKTPGRAAAWLAAAGLAACGRGTNVSTAQRDGGPLEATPAVANEDATADAAPLPGAEATAEPTGPADVPTAPVAVDDAEVLFDVQAPGNRDRYCAQGAPRSGRFLLEARLAGPEVRAVFERFEDSADGAWTDYVAPDGSRAQGALNVQAVRGRRTVTAVFRREGDGAGTLRRTVHLFEYGDGEASVGPEPQPEPECDFVRSDMPAPSLDRLVEADGPVVFAQTDTDGGTRGWAQDFELVVGLRAGIAGELEGDPEFECTTGRGSVAGNADGLNRYREPQAGPGGVPRLKHLFELRYSPGSRREPNLVAGEHSCTVRYRLRQGGQVRTYEGVLSVRIAADGTVEIGAPRTPATEGVPDTGALRHPGLPLPFRYPVTVACLADYGEALLLEASCPVLPRGGRPTFRWDASAGAIEPLDGGRRALWRPAEGVEPAVATCAVQAGPLDLQVGSFRRG